MRHAVLLLAPMVVACNPGPDERADSQPPRSPPAHSIARAESRPVPDAGPEEMVERGRERYAIFCSPCHGVTGLGNGTAVARGFPAPPSFLDSGTRDLDPAAIAGIIAEGQGRMLPMAERIAPADRRAIAVYVTTLRAGEVSPEAEALQ